MKRTAAVLSVIFLALWYLNDSGILLIPVIILGGAAIGIFGLFTETLGWITMASGAMIAYDGYLGIGIAIAVFGIILIKFARTHGLLYDIFFASSMSLDDNDEP